MSEQIDENVLECIKKSGYPLEMEISNKFDNDWKVDNTGYYYDYDENKGRDIDIVAAYKKSIWNHKQWNASYNVIVECKKKEDDAWIFFTRPHLSIDGCNQMTVDTMLLSRDDLGSACNAFVIGVKPHYYFCKDIAVAYDAINIKKKKQSGDRSIFEAVNQLSKYIEYQARSKMGHFNPEVFSDGKEGIVFSYSPIIVFDGLLYSARTSRSGIELKQSEHIILKSERKIAYSSLPLEIYVDIVTKNAFASILPTIIDDFNKINRYIKSKSFKDAIRDPIPLFPFVEEREMGRISD